MINETEKMRDARHELQVLSASDPLARSNMLRHVAACTQLLTGRPGFEALPSEPLVGAGFRLVHGEEKLFGALTRVDGIERIYIGFDIDDPQGPPFGLGLFRKEGVNVVCYGVCRLWSPANDGRGLLVPEGEGGPKGYFGFRKGQPFRWVAGHVPGDLEGGLRRAQARYARFLKSAEADALVSRGVGAIVNNVGQEVRARPLPLAA